LTSDNNNQKKCGFCGENIPAGAGRCPYCGSILEVTFDNSYRIEQPEEKPVSGDPDGQENTEQQQIGQNNVTNPVPPVGRPGQQSEYSTQMHNAYKPYNGGSYPPNYNYGGGVKQPLSNGMKVFLTVLFTVLPGVGQLAGIIAAIVFMNSDGDSDRKSFGVALLVASLVMFVISCIGCFILMVAISSNQMNYNF